MDVDGTLTDGKVYIGPSGECVKAFDIKDGLGIKDILPTQGIVPVIITGRKSEMLRIRSEELGITHLFQGVANKISKLSELLQECNVSYSEVAYIGDDLNDKAVMELCGLKGCPADAVDEIKAISDFVATRGGGNGAVREFIEFIVKAQM